ncbi:threonine aldolase family protein [Alloscardovia omnicolens]|uniref:threonine aldolase family protein n=1 Tax=Alloscardovia omnicolens TaxID=419015 RepID=UPI000668948E|nr:aminotransferase class I/II-fold pyridoxal phosphate-dependent enzyme [Alloscardovia omnicolens]EGT4752470.1 aminotransferase class I/II-fold pyridoxal phosphate-dependent enzyme [Clostridioides difficile]MDK6521824.1 aminotransferase class I/II-fold pyridoxal phosphate-dependent enzyme [Alloscardovia omnicolens]
MLAFHNDYHAGAHPKVLKALVSTNGAAQDGYGADEYSESARARIRHAIEDEQAEVFFVTGGTQTNQLVIDTMLSAWEGVISADTGHVSVHEAGAIEFCGHKVLTVPSENGLMDPNDVRSLARNFYDDPNHEHMVFPGMVYLSYPSEYGTLYSADQLHEIRAICDEFNMCLFIDGARLAYALGSASEHLSLTQLAQIADAFYAGGTKAGALLGEAVIFPAGRGERGSSPAHFITQMKQHGALLAQGRAMGVQFDALFTDGLYERIGTQADELAQRLVGVMRSHGFEEYLISSTNQQFFVMNKKQFEALSAVAQVSLWEAPRNGRYIVRMVTGWDTTEEMIDQLDKALSI